MCVRCKRRIACKCGVCVQGGYYALVKVPPNPKGQTTHVCIYLYWLIFQSNKKPFCQYKRENAIAFFSPLKTHTSKSVKMSKRHVLLYLLEKFFVPAITISDICGGIERLMCFLGRGSYKKHQKYSAYCLCISFIFWMFAFGCIRKMALGYWRKDWNRL